MQRMHHRSIGLSLALALAMGTAAAQELGDIAGKAKLSDAERAKRDADKVYQWIRFHADKAAAKAATPPANSKPAAAPAPVAKAAPAANSAAAVPARPRAEAVVAQPPAAPEALPSVAAAASSQVLPELLASAAPVAAPVLPTPAARAAAQPPAPEEEELPLTLVQRVEPEFPHQVLRAGGSGSVQVRFTVKPDGSVSGAEAVKSSNPRLVRSVLEAVARWRFAPIREARSATVEVGFRTD